MSKRFAALASTLAVALTLSACANTVRGVGQDVRATGEAVQEQTRR